MGIQKLYKKLYEAVGGKENIELLLQKAESCTVVVKDASLIAPEKVQTLPEVKAVELYVTESRCCCKIMIWRIIQWQKSIIRNLLPT